ncbi:hypothetical protein FD754_023270 [Muntiacus muntjak]|uniref:Secreted protein n=1 Tax=Muntiacus muntjak TaxID=9888 RepID=A0A5N3UU23_MUNMU|nr:hypothetical protein FD754_023274 [Muntiacus muntjak]KAB0340274.1 hypothetical protein FD754_023270 [Muntiacus muntjak]
MENMLECAFIVLWVQLGCSASTAATPSAASEGYSGIDKTRGRALNSFLLYSAGDGKQKERLRATLLKKASSLHIEAPKPKDSATYLCAVQTQCSPGTCRPYPNSEAAALE